MTTDALLLEDETRRKNAIVSGLFSYTFWGFFPIYWKLLGRIPSVEILAHRMIWSCLFYLMIYAYGSVRSRSQTLSLRQQPLKQWSFAFLAAAVLSLNWGLYIYAVKSGQIVQGSLAYFINPLMNVAVGVVAFKEKFPRILKIACAFAAAGVLIQMAFAPQFPTIALSLAITFCAYGIVKKSLTIPPDISSALEGISGFLPALILAYYLRSQSHLEILPWEWLLLVGSGVVTGLPLLLFSAAAQRLPYSLMGMMQFIAPSLQFLVGIAMYGERLDTAGLLSFSLIWIGAGLYFWHLLRRTYGGNAKPSEK